ncbi:MAG: SEC-C metal-binding domain-containing protein, partial [Polaromonas sp.]
MTHKTGRNDPCPCGSGKKYKHCCGKPAAPAASAAESHEGAVERAVAWLAQHHRKAFAAALQTSMDEAIGEIFDDEDEAREAMTGLREELWQNLQINLTEWLLAEGDILVKGE